MKLRAVCAEFASASVVFYPNSVAGVGDVQNVAMQGLPQNLPYNFPLETALDQFDLRDSACSKSRHYLPVCFE